MKLITGSLCPHLLAIMKITLIILVNCRIPSTLANRRILSTLTSRRILSTLTSRHILTIPKILHTLYILTHQ